MTNHLRLSASLKKNLKKQISGRLSIHCLLRWGAIDIVFEKQEDIAKINEEFLAEYKDVLVFRECEKASSDLLCFQVSSDYALKIKESAIGQAIETIRGRIDERGIAEPSVVRKGRRHHCGVAGSW